MRSLPAHHRENAVRWPEGSAENHDGQGNGDPRDPPRAGRCERALKGITMDQLAAAQRSAVETGKQMTAGGKNVRYIRSTFVPGEARCMCRFEAPGPELVKELNERAAAT